MKKVFVAVLAVIMIIFGLYIRGGVERTQPFSVTSEGGCVRADTFMSAQNVMDKYGAVLLWTEDFDDLTVYYCYSDFVCGYETVCGKRVNIMIAEREEYTAVGMPLLTGSY